MAICTLILDNFVGYCFNQFCQNNDEFQEITTGVFFFFWHRKFVSHIHQSLSSASGIPF